jgi:tetratricopeptide (TPR) repeat protein
MVLHDFGELAEAHDLLCKALKSAVQSFPPVHHRIATQRSNLALVLKDLGELPEARDLLRNALTAYEQSFPLNLNHPWIAGAQSSLAAVLHDLGELAEARDLMEKAHAAALAQFGQEDRRTKDRRRFLDAWSTNA